MGQTFGLILLRLGDYGCRPHDLELRVLAADVEVYNALVTGFFVPNRSFVQCEFIPLQLHVPHDAQLRPWAVSATGQAVRTWTQDALFVHGVLMLQLNSLFPSVWSHPRASILNLKPGAVGWKEGKLCNPRP